MYVNETIIKASADIIQTFHICYCSIRSQSLTAIYAFVYREKKAVLWVEGMFLRLRLPFTVYVWET